MFTESENKTEHNGGSGTGVVEPDMVPYAIKSSIRIFSSHTSLQQSIVKHQEATALTSVLY